MMRNEDSIKARSTGAAALAAQPNMREWVVQRYVDPPALLGGRKWHARVYALAVGAVDDVYEAVGVAEVVPPQGAELLLPPDVPDGEEDVFVLDLFDVEA